MGIASKITVFLLLPANWHRKGAARLFTDLPPKSNSEQSRKISGTASALTFVLTKSGICIRVRIFFGCGAFIHESAA